MWIGWTIFYKYLFTDNFVYKPKDISSIITNLKKFANFRKKNHYFRPPYVKIWKWKNSEADDRKDTFRRQLLLLLWNEQIHKMFSSNWKRNLMFVLGKARKGKEQTQSCLLLNLSYEIHGIAKLFKEFVIFFYLQKESNYFRLSDNERKIGFFLFLLVSNCHFSYCHAMLCQFKGLLI